MSHFVGQWHHHHHAGPTQMAPRVPVATKAPHLAGHMAVSKFGSYILQIWQAQAQAQAQQGSRWNSTRNHLLPEFHQNFYQKPEGPSLAPEVDF